MLKELGDEETTQLLSSFTCPRNPDVENFLITPDKAIRFEQADSARTYLILDDNTGDVLAYFSVSFKELLLDGVAVSKSQVKNMDGINKNADRIRTFLIGQIGKNHGVDGNPIGLGAILEEIYSVIADAQALIGGRTVILECEDNEGLIRLYQQHGFRLIENAENPPQDQLRTMFTVVKN